MYIRYISAIKGANYHLFSQLSISINVYLWQIELIFLIILLIVLIVLITSHIAAWSSFSDFGGLCLCVCGCLCNQLTSYLTFCWGLRPRHPQSLLRHLGTYQTEHRTNRRQSLKGVRQHTGTQIKFENEAICVHSLSLPVLEYQQAKLCMRR